MHILYSMQQCRFRFSPLVKIIDYLNKTFSRYFGWIFYYIPKTVRCCWGVTRALPISPIEPSSRTSGTGWDYWRWLRTNQFFTSTSISRVSSMRHITRALRSFYTLFHLLPRSSSRQRRAGFELHLIFRQICKISPIAMALSVSVCVSGCLLLS